MKDLTLPASVSTTWLDKAATLPALQVRNPQGEALISLQGAQILRFQATGKAPLLWVSEDTAYAPGKSIRGGIPICFPWFGAHATDASKPAHGFARHRLWTLLSARDHADHSGQVTQTELVFSLRDDASTQPLWPHAFVATLTVTLGSTLSASLRVTNTDILPFRFSFALHSYFPVTDIRQTRVEGLEDNSFTDTLQDNRLCPPEHAAIRFAQETDRVYETASGCYRIVDEVRDRTLRIDAPSCRSAIVWNPWSAKAARMGDMGTDGWQHMLCVESGNAWRDSIELAAGQSREFRLQLDSD